MMHATEHPIPLAHISHDARRVLQALGKESEACVFDQMVIMMWCFNYGEEKVYDILKSKCETLHLRDAILATGEEEFVHYTARKPIQELNPEDLEGKSSAEITKLVREQEKKRERQLRSMPKKTNLRIFRFYCDEAMDRVTEYMILIDRELLVADYQFSFLDTMFRLLEDIEPGVFDDFMGSLDRNRYTMWFVDNRLELFMGDLSKAEEAYLAEYTKFEKSPAREADPKAVSILDALSERFKKFGGHHGSR
jgi:hypothetical protein